MGRTPIITPVAISALALVDNAVVDDDVGADIDVDVEEVLEGKAPDTRVINPLPMGDAVKEDVDVGDVLDLHVGSIICRSLYDHTIDGNSIGSQRSSNCYTGIDDGIGGCASVGHSTK